MSQSSFPSKWLNQLTDPYSVLGVSVVADDRRVQKRYRSIAMLLHPDRYVQADEATKQFVSQMLARLVNPAYEKLKQEKGRAENVALLRLQVRRLNREVPLTPQSDLARQLIQHPASGVDVFYEQAIAQLSERQYQPLDQFEAITLQLGELNLMYLQLKMGEVFIREKRTGLVAAPEAKPMQFVPVADQSEKVTESYAQRHYRRAQEYMKNSKWAQAVQELRDAIKLEADKSEYHSLLGVAYLRQNLAGMATVYFRQALKLNPNDALAAKYAGQLGIKDVAATNGHSTKQTAKQTTHEDKDKLAKNSGLFGLFRSKK